MCGISGYWGYAAADLPRPLFESFTHSLSHRGPDGFGIEHFAEQRLWLGHRRLSIIDLSERGRQPMSFGGARYWLTYNGEIYNFIELRATLTQLGYRFLSGSDSEVILAAYAQWGPSCQLRFNGMWAFAIWDAQARTLFLSRDRFGVKPLHYSQRRGALLFASELKAFLSLPEVSGAFDEEVLAETLANVNGQEGTPHTLLPGVSRLPGGHALTLSADGSLSIARWWDTQQHVVQVPQRLEEQTAQFRSLFTDACRLRLRSDVPIATALSGGLDSSAIACTLAALRQAGAVEHAPENWHRAFVAYFPGTRLDERLYARRIVEHAAMAAHYEDVDDAIGAQALERIVFEMEGIYWVPLVGPWSIYRAMRANAIRVSLDGHGADELLGGYHFFVERALEGILDGGFDLARYLDLKRVLRSLVGGSADIARTDFLGDLRRVALRELRRLGLLQPSRAAARRLVSLRRRADPLLAPYGGPRRLYEEDSDPRLANMMPLSAMLFSWFHASVLPTILRSYDRASMAHGIEVRMPFMDWRLVTFCFGLPEASKIGGGYTKRVLRLAMEGLMPESIRLRTDKIGFTSPLDEWARGRLRTWVSDTVDSRSFLEAPLWRGDAVRDLVRRALDGRASVNPAWPILNAHLLQESFKSAARGEAARTAVAI